MSHMTNPNAPLLTFDLPLWDIGSTAYLGQLPNQDVGPTSYLGIAPLRNLRTWSTERYGDLTVTLEQAFLLWFSKWLWLPEIQTLKGKANLKTGAFATYLNLTTPPLKPWLISNAHSTQPLNPKIAYLQNLPKMYNIFLAVKRLEHPILAITPSVTVRSPCLSAGHVLGFLRGVVPK